MPKSRFNGFTDYEIGIGLRAPHYQHILSRKPVVDWFEIISENSMIDGGRPLHILDQILDQYGRSEVMLYPGRLSRKCNGSRGKMARTCEQKVNKEEKLTLTSHRNLLILLGKRPLR